MKPEETNLLVKGLEGTMSYVRESYKEFAKLGLGAPSHNKFYEFLKDRISKSLTDITGADNLHK